MAQFTDAACLSLSLQYNPFHTCPHVVLQRRELLWFRKEFGKVQRLFFFPTPPLLDELTVGWFWLSKFTVCGWPSPLASRPQIKFPKLASNSNSTLKLCPKNCGSQLNLNQFQVCWLNGDWFEFATCLCLSYQSGPLLLLANKFTFKSTPWQSVTLKITSLFLYWPTEGLKRKEFMFIDQKDSLNACTISSDVVPISWFVKFQPLRAV